MICYFWEGQEYISIRASKYFSLKGYWDPSIIVGGHSRDGCRVLLARYMVFVSNGNHVKKTVVVASVTTLSAALTRHRL